MFISRSGENLVHMSGLAWVSTVGRLCTKRRTMDPSLLSPSPSQRSAKHHSALFFFCGLPAFFSSTCLAVASAVLLTLSATLHAIIVFLNCLVFVCMCWRVWWGVGLHTTPVAASYVLLSFFFASVIKNDKGRKEKIEKEETKGGAKCGCVGRCGCGLENSNQSKTLDFVGRYHLFPWWKFSFGSCPI